MPTIDLGVDFGTVQEMDKFPLLPNGVHPFVVEKIELTQTGPNSKTAGRPMLKWTLGFNHPDNGQHLNLTYMTVLPWIPPGTTEMDVSGVGQLVAICKATGQPWAGQKLDPDIYIGRGGAANIIQRKRNKQNEEGKWVEDPNSDPQNDFDRSKPFVY